MMGDAVPQTPWDLSLSFSRMDVFLFTANGTCRTIEMLDRNIGQRRDATRAPIQARNGWRLHGRRLGQPASPSKDARYFVQTMGSTSYSASKAALRSFARTWLVELKERRIRVNVLSPGTIDTPGLDPLGSAAKDSFKALIPRGEMGRPEEIATVALFLASSDSSFVNGVELFVDGGAAQI